MHTHMAEMFSDGMGCVHVTIHGDSDWLTFIQKTTQAVLRSVCGMNCYVRRFIFEWILIAMPSFVRHIIYEWILTAMSCFIRHITFE